MRELFFLPFVFPDGIIDPYYIQGLREAIFIRGGYAVAGRSNRAGSVVSFHDAGQFGGYSTPVRAALLGNFIPDAPQDYGGVVPVTQQHIAQVPFMPVFEI